MDIISCLSELKQELRMKATWKFPDTSFEKLCKFAIPLPQLQRKNEKIGIFIESLSLPNVVSQLLHSRNHSHSNRSPTVTQAYN